MKLTEREVEALKAVLYYERISAELDYADCGDRPHIVHDYRVLWSKIKGFRSTTLAESNRMTREEYELYAAGLCSHNTEYGNGRGIIYCREPVYRKRKGTFLERSACAEHVRDEVENYGPSAHH